MTAVADGSTSDTVIAAAFTIGSATRTDLLTAAVTAHAPTNVIEELLRLPERCYRSPAEVSALLADPRA